MCLVRVSGGSGCSVEMVGSSLARTENAEDTERMYPLQTFLPPSSFLLRISHRGRRGRRANVPTSNFPSSFLPPPSSFVSRTEAAEDTEHPTPTSLHGRECASAISEGAVMASRGDSTLRLLRQPAWNDVGWDDMSNLDILQQTPPRIIAWRGSGAISEGWCW